MKKKMVIGIIVAVVLCGGYFIGFGVFEKRFCLYGWIFRFGGRQRNYAGYWRCGIKGVYQENGDIPTDGRKALY